MRRVAKEHGNKLLAFQNSQRAGVILRDFKLTLNYGKRAKEKIMVEGLKDTKKTICE